MSSSINRYLRRIQTQNLAITTSNKHGSTNLVNFFGDFDVINATKVEELEVPKTVIVITRNEKDRWCSGVVQELSRLEDNLDELDKDTIYDILDREVNSLGNKSIFTYDRSHLGEQPYFPYIIQLLLDYNTHFTDISSLNKKSFWKKICELDDTWPRINEFFEDWQEHLQNQSKLYSHKTFHGPPKGESKRGEIVNVVKDMLDTDKRLDFIFRILNARQIQIDNLKESNMWI